MTHNVAQNPSYEDILAYSELEIFKKRLVDLTLDTVLNVGTLLSILTEMFGMTVHAVKAEFSQRGERFTKKKL